MMIIGGGGVGRRRKEGDGRRKMRWKEGSIVIIAVCPGITTRHRVANGARQNIGVVIIAVYSITVFTEFGKTCFQTFCLL